MNRLPNAPAMSLGSTCVLSLKATELPSRCGGRPCASPCMVFQQVPAPFPWSHGLPTCSPQTSVSPVSMRVEISLSSSGMLGCCGVFPPVQFPCPILLRMSCGRSLPVSRILPTGMYVFPALYSMLANVPFASCMSVGGRSAAKASPVSRANLSQSAFLQLAYDRLFCCTVCLLSVCIVSSIGRWSEPSA